jgi:hypothetical protein
VTVDVRCGSVIAGRSADEGRCQLHIGHVGGHALVGAAAGHRELWQWSTPTPHPGGGTPELDAVRLAGIDEPVVSSLAAGPPYQLSWAPGFPRVVAAPPVARSVPRLRSVA